jgi:hypothetical protein
MGCTILGSCSNVQVLLAWSDAISSSITYFYTLEYSDYSASSMQVASVVCSSVAVLATVDFHSVGACHGLVG